MAHGSRHVEGVVETRSLDRRLDDDNSRRHLYVLAMHDWCWGGDTQGLLMVQDENRFYSHDHGWYLPPEGADWTVDALEANVDTPHELAASYDGFSGVLAAEVAERLEAVTRGQLVALLSGIPSSWPASDHELECVGFFLERRAAQVAARLRNRFR